eukprot:7109183-Alexandrium_andersonii.AAC.1
MMWPSSGHKSSAASGGTASRSARNPSGSGLRKVSPQSFGSSMRRRNSPRSKLWEYAGAALPDFG